MKYTFCLLVTLACLLPVSAQQITPMSRASLDSLVYPPVMTGADRVLKFQRYTAHIDTITEVHPAILLVYPFCNVSTDTVNITKVRTLCGCTQATESARQVPPGETDSITIRFLPLGKLGPLHQRSYVYTTHSMQPLACLEIIGFVTDKADVQETKMQKE